MTCHLVSKVGYDDVRKIFLGIFLTLIYRLFAKSVWKFFGLILEGYAWDFFGGKMVIKI